MEFDPKFALDPMLPLVEAAYDLSKIPSGWEVIGKLEPDDFGFVATRTIGQTATVVSIAGTRTKEQWEEDFDAVPVPAKVGEGMVHRGFQSQYFKIRESIQKALRWTAGPLLITCHSLGASLGQLCAADFSDRKPLVYAFESPRVGNIQWASWFNKNIPDCYRIVDEWDPVPHQPPFLFGFKHAGHPVYINSGFTLDWHTAHSLELACGPGLQKLIRTSKP